MAHEFFYTDENGKKQDAALHDEILDNPEADKSTRQQSANRAKDRGMTDDAIEALYGVRPNDYNTSKYTRGLDGEILRFKNGNPIPIDAFD